MALCYECAKNSFLKKMALEKGSTGYCLLCERKQTQVIEIGSLAYVIREAMRNYTHPKGEMWQVGGDDLRLEELEYDEFGAVVEGIIGQKIPFLQQLLHGIVSSEVKIPGHRSFFRLDQKYALAPPARGDYMSEPFESAWESVIHELKHGRRFFGTSVSDLFSRLFENVGDLKSVDPSTPEYESVVREVGSEFRLFRARKSSSGNVDSIIADPFKEVGPPPKDKAAAGRMSAEGVVSLYAAREVETAIAELRPSIGQVVATIELRPSKKLILLDFKRLERVIAYEWSDLLDPQFAAKSIAKRFLRELHRLISQPVATGRETEYLITQAMAEYLRHVHPKKFDGVLFGSVQHNGGTNVVLFSGGASRYAGEWPFAVEYVENTLTFHRTEKISYENLPIGTRIAKLTGA